MEAPALLFYGLAGLSLLGSLAMVGFARNLVAGTLCLLVTMISLAGIFVLLEAHLIGALQLLLYPATVLVLFLFVIMLLDPRVDDLGPLRPVVTMTKGLGAVVGAALLIFVARHIAGTLEGWPQSPDGYGSARTIGTELFSRYFVSVEIASMLLLAAVVGAIVLAKGREH